MEQLLIEVAKQSPVAVVAIFAIWRISIVMVNQTTALTDIVKTVIEAKVTEKHSNGVRS